MTDITPKSEFAIGDTEEDDVFTEGDTPIEDIDWDQVVELEHRQNEVLKLPEGEERSMAMLGLLHEMHGDDLQVL